ncbi:hypothetical protein TUBRATIS_24100 [Tubulinosema ratisbonensis]|uniref:Uncharacterized protein n=1 Tax=Tubulinosema ratisbonensis TaxID=291195 RepID=A0A437AJ63_9MICR|nr:hypothetical protein TUBRATIS_24100 [Tubulinosema ratisbonensis]
MIFFYILNFICVKRKNIESTKDLQPKRQKTTLDIDNMDLLNDKPSENSNCDNFHDKILSNEVILADDHNNIIDYEAANLQEHMPDIPDELDKLFSEIENSDFTSSSLEEDYFFECERFFSDKDLSEQNDYKLSSIKFNELKKPDRKIIVNSAENTYEENPNEIYIQNFIGIENYDREFGKHDKYFKRFLANLDETIILLHQNNYKNTTFSDSYGVIKEPDQLLKLDRLYFDKNIYFYNKQKILESKYKLNLSAIFRFLTPLHRSNKRFINFFDNYGSPSEEIIAFRDNFILNVKIYSRFGKRRVKENISFQKRLQSLLNEFIMLVKEYAESLSLIFEKDIKNYSENFRDSFFEPNPQTFKTKMMVMAHDIFNNEDNSIVLTLFPELKIFFEYLKETYQLRNDYKYLHIIFSLIIFRTHFLFPSNLNKYSKIYRFYNSKNFYLSILESRLFICLMGLSLKLEKHYVSILIYKSFYAFVRLKDIKFLNYFLVSDFFDFNEKIDPVNFKNVRFGTEKKAPEKRNRQILWFTAIIFPESLISEKFFKYESDLRVVHYYFNPNLNNLELGYLQIAAFKHLTYKQDLFVKLQLFLMKKK